MTECLTEGLEMKCWDNYLVFERSSGKMENRWSTVDGYWIETIHLNKPLKNQLLLVSQTRLRL